MPGPGPVPRRLVVLSQRACTSPRSFSAHLLQTQAQTGRASHFTRISRPVRSPSGSRSFSELVHGFQRLLQKSCLGDRWQSLFSGNVLPSVTGSRAGRELRAGRVAFEPHGQPSFLFSLCGAFVPESQVPCAVRLPVGVNSEAGTGAFSSSGDVFPHSTF